ncbi:transcriptional regulator [Zafaria cholistanensis]|uniref:Transcriptional regulator n=1 Tax=Zafaria cholistanensis TaxID=1682741 RepID=A0A5A7NUD5_9MICC|nr:PucR family transcriptional regulator ligand-binding domain-containing protein [Zafaria cholistanensis]GER24329.1 transcriptional regulator [Zafaria cholistanensis]
MPTLASALRFQSLLEADPVVRTAPEGGLDRGIRWVHSSEVLAIAPLLRGGEVLLTGGTALLALGDAGRKEYVESLAARDVAALAVETTGWDAAALEALAEAAAHAGLTLVELRRVVRFVDVAEEINSAIVNRQARIQSVVDGISRRIAEHIATRGPELPAILRLAADGLDARVRLTGHDGSLHEAGDGKAEGAQPDPGSPPRSAETAIAVGGYVAARLVIESDSADDDLLSSAANRLSEVLALALAQSFHPSADQVAEGRLVQAVLDGAPRTAVGRLWAGTALAPGPACVVLALPLGPATAHEAALRRAAPQAAAGTWGRGRILLVPLAGADPLGRRGGLVRALSESTRAMPVRCAVGPLVWDGTGAHESFTEARDLLDEAAEQPGIVDVSAQFGHRVDRHLEAAAFVPVHVRSALGRVQDWDRRHGTPLVETLARWLDFGCNATATAARLHIERQTLHKRLSKSFELLGGDPRTTGEVFALHVAVRVALLEAGLA